MGIVGGWLTVQTTADLGNPPPPLYIADMLLEAAQVRLHDGLDAMHPDTMRIPEGNANLRFSLSNIPIGITAERIRSAIQQNLEADPTSLIDVASQLFDNGSGAADFFYVRAEDDNPEDLRGDWLYFVTADDMGKDSQGTPKRDYARYTNPGFYADAELSRKISSKARVNGDTAREKVRIDPDVAERKTYYYQDDENGVFEVEAVRKPSDRRLTLRVKRIR